jgi:hypothetical protein
MEVTAPTPTFADHFSRAANRRAWQVGAWTMLMAMLVGAAFGIAPVASVVLIVGVAIPILFWRYPRACLYTIFGAVSLSGRRKAGQRVRWEEGRLQFTRPHQALFLLHQSAGEYQ